MKNHSMTERLIKQYISEIKTLFPTIGKKEKTYLQKMEENINETLSDEEISVPDSIEQLYTLFGVPCDIVHQYLSEMDIDTFQDILKLRKFRKHMIEVICSILAFLVILISALALIQHKSFMDSLPASTTTEIEIIESED